MRTTTPVLTALASLAAASVALAVPATIPGHPVAGPQATDSRYVNQLEASGWYIEDEAQMVKVAHAECAQLGRGITTADLVDKVVRKYHITGEAAVTQLIAAELAYCPQFMRNPLPDNGFK